MAQAAPLQPQSPSPIIFMQRYSVSPMRKEQKTLLIRKKFLRDDE
jgi:hypothetical protein